MIKELIKKSIKDNYLLFSFFKKIKASYLIIKKLNQNAQEGTLIPRFGNLKIRLNAFDINERALLWQHDIDSGEIQALKNLLDEDSEVIFVKPKSALLPAFIGINIGCSMTIVGGSEKVRKDLAHNMIKNISFTDEIKDIASGTPSYRLIVMSEKHTKRFSPLPEHDALLVISQKLKNRIDIAIPGNHQYNWVAGRALPVTRGAKSRHFLFSNRRYETLNILSKKGEKKISGFSLLRNADIYPFDLCYESIMEVVDEFVLAIDKNYPPNHGVGEESRQRLIEKFLDNTAYPDKVRIIDTFDFGERFCRKMSTPGRWIADTNNYLLDNCSHENCVYVMADEMYDENAFGEICKFAYQTKYSAMSHYFLHFIYDLKHIRNPQTVAYTHAIRVFKRDLYASYHDGYSFFPLIRNNDMRIIEAKYPIYHLGYVMDLRRKFGVHTSEGGIFTKSNSYGKNVFDADIVEYKGPYPKFLQNQKMSSYSKIAHLIRTIPT